MSCSKASAAHQISTKDYCQSALCISGALAAALTLSLPAFATSSPARSISLSAKDLEVLPVAPVEPSITLVRDPAFQSLSTPRFLIEPDLQTDDQPFASHTTELSSEVVTSSINSNDASEQASTVLPVVESATAEIIQVPQIAQATGSDQFGSTLTPEEAQQLIDDLEPIVDVTAKPRPTPGTTFGTPTAFGASWRQAFVGASGIIDFAGVGRDDGSISAGIGFGDPVKAVGLETSVSITSVSADDFADSGSAGFKIHKIIPGTDGLGVAVGWTNALDWGDAKDAPETVYGVVSKNFSLRPKSRNRLPLLGASVGVGTGSFRTVKDINNGNDDPNVFGNLGVVLIPQVSLATSWTGNRLNMGIGLAPFRFPLTFTAGVTDVTNNTVSGTGLNINAGYSIQF